MIEAKNLTKVYGSKKAVDDLSFSVQPGKITGFLGPNGAGKSTTMRMILGLDAPTSGSVTVNGMPYQQLPAPLSTVGALLEARSIQPGRTAYNHLYAIAASNGIPRSRVDAVIEIVGLREVAKKRAGGFSLGMGQRLGLAVALLGDPEILILDEPVNGLDPEGILWIRNLLKYLASNGKTVFVSSHLMSEMSLTADHLIVIGRGRLIADTSVQEFIDKASRNYAKVRSPQLDQLKAALLESKAEIWDDAEGGLDVSGLPLTTIGEIAAARGLVLHELSPQKASLEEAFMELTGDAVEYSASAGNALLVPPTPTQGEQA